MRATSRALTMTGAAALALTLAPSTSAMAAETPQSQGEQVAQVQTTGDTTTLTYENGATFSSSALRAGSFDWEAEFDVGIYSRSYSTPNSGTHSISIDSITNCDPLYETGYIRLEEDVLFGWDEVDTVTIDCSGDTATFSGVPSGTYRWYLRVHGDSSGSTYGRYASGTTYYP